MLCSQDMPAPSRFYSAFDTENMAPRKAAEGEHRTAFQIDRDRILHSSAFRRLQSKTQVFLSGEYDFYRTRLTHSIEVSQIGRSICDWLGKTSPVLDAETTIDADLVEAACLSHDLGHPPFGHTGERTLHRLMEPYGGFEGNAQTLRLLTETLFADGQAGMHPTRALLDAILKYKTLFTEANGAVNHYLYDDQDKYLDFVLDDQAFPLELTPGKVRNGFKSLECQIMDWADDTAYSINDLADGIQAGFITISKLEDWAARQTLNADETAQIDFLIKAMREQRVEARLGRCIGEHIRACTLKPTANFLSQATKRYQFDLEVEPSLLAKAKLNKRISYELVFKTPQLQQLDFKAAMVLEKLFDALRERYIENPPKHKLHLLPEGIEQIIERGETPNARARLVCDWVANLTDRGAFRVYQRLFDAGFGSITDFV